MKTRLLPLICFILSSGVNAQPALTNAIMPGHGDILKIHNAQYQNPGPSGANQNWNFSGLNSASVKNFTAGPVSSTPYASSYTASTMQMNDGTNYYFWIVSATDAKVEGFVDTAGNQPNTIDLEKRFQFPLQYSNSFSDYWSGFFAWTGAGWNSFNMRTATTDVVYDGYGTLVTPSGTFQNVSRVHTHQALSTMGNHTGVTFINDEYSWYSNLFHGPLLTVYTQTLTRGQDTLSNTIYFSGSKYQELDPTNFVGLSESAFAINTISYPNPANHILRVSAADEKIIGVMLYDSSGKLCHSEDSEGSMQSLAIYVADYPEGIYLVLVKTRDGKIGHQKVTISH